MNETLTPPVAVAGLQWRPLTQGDAEALYNLLSQLDDAERASYRTTRDEIDRMLARDGGWIGVGGCDPKNPDEMLAFGYVGVSRVGQRIAHCEGGVHPSLRGEGVGRVLLQWQTENGTNLLRETFPGKKTALVHTVSDHHPKLQIAIKGLGYKWTNSHAELRRDVDDLLPTGDLPTRLQLRQWTEDLDNLARRAYNRASAEMGSDSYMTPADWEALVQGMRREWSHLVINKAGDRPEVVGMMGVSAYEQDWEFLGWSEGMVELIAVFGTEHRDEILMSLMSAAMRSIDDSDVDKICVSLDPVKDEDMFPFYVSLGFDVGSSYHTYQHNLNAVPQAP